MDILLKNTIEVDFLNIPITVPTPEAYVLHKMIINNERGIKKDKDKEAIIFLYPHLDKNSINKLRSDLSKKENKSIEQFMNENIIDNSK